MRSRAAAETGFISLPADREVVPRGSAVSAFTPNYCISCDVRRRINCRSIICVRRTASGCQPPSDRVSTIKNRHERRSFCFEYLLPWMRAGTVRSVDQIVRKTLQCLCDYQTSNTNQSVKHLKWTVVHLISAKVKGLCFSAGFFWHCNAE